jgi:hypothetical protein
VWRGDRGGGGGGDSAGSAVVSVAHCCACGGSRWTRLRNARCPAATVATFTTNSAVVPDDLHDDGSRCTTVVHRGETAVPLLTCVCVGKVATETTEV